MESNGLDPRNWYAQLPALPQQSLQALEPVLKATTQGQAELSSLVTRRVRAWMEAPGRAAQCRTPQDFAAAQMQFVQAAYQDYATASRRVAEVWGPVWGGLMQLPRLDANAGWWSSTDLGRAAARDYIAVPETREQSAATDPRRPGERRAA